MRKFTLTSLQTPCLLLDKGKLICNTERLKRKMLVTNTVLRIHMKSAKSIQIANLLSETKAITVSTLKEAEVFAEAGFLDIIYAVGLAPQKIPRIRSLISKGADLKVIVDSEAHIEAIATSAGTEQIKVLIEIDCDGHRGGISFKQIERILRLARSLDLPAAKFHGILIHAGESYEAKDEQSLINASMNEQMVATHVANQLRYAGIPCPIISIGSTPTALLANNLKEITEMRAGVFMFFDLFQYNLGLCSAEDIALSVLTTVISRQADKGWIFIDAGWMALSRDRGTSRQKVDYFYGMVCDEHGNIIPDLLVISTHQEHGVLAMRPGSEHSLPNFSLGTLLRILPIHACATASQFENYYVLDDTTETIEIWPRFSGW